MGELRDVRPTEAIRALLAAGGIRKPGKGDHVKRPKVCLPAFEKHQDREVVLRKAGVRGVASGAVSLIVVPKRRVALGGWPPPAAGGGWGKLAEARGAIESHLIALIADGQEIPRDAELRVETVTVEVPSAA
ncbi:MAG: hypothetical protein IPO51_04855 [Dehalococcoidia bacterium]|nr:hypothetical protein [Dehalococcoidia bacterium]